MPRVLPPQCKNPHPHGHFLAIAYAGYTQSWAFSGKDMGEARPPLAGILEHVPYAWETWVILIAPLILTLRIINAEDLFNQSPAWLFWSIQAVYLYILAATLTFLWQNLTRRLRRA